MSVIANRINVAAGATLRNVLADEKFRMLRAPTIVRGGVVIAFAAVIPGRFTFTIGDKVVADNATAPNERAAGAGVDLNTQLKIADAGLAGDELSLEISNPGAAAFDMEWYFILG